MKQWYTLYVFLCSYVRCDDLRQDLLEVNLSLAGYRFDFVSSIQ